MSDQSFLFSMLCVDDFLLYTCGSEIVVLKHYYIDLCYRIVHGLAGPGGVLGLVPAVQLHNVPLAVIYLGTFCLCSTLTMGFVAFGYGACSSRVSNIGEQGRHRREFLIACLSSGLSVVVGAAWLVLLAIGKLEDVFP